jgi:hypothetical protein
MLSTQLRPLMHKTNIAMRQIITSLVQRQRLCAIIYFFTSHFRLIQTSLRSYLTTPSISLSPHSDIPYTLYDHPLLLTLAIIRSTFIVPLFDPSAPVFDNGRCLLARRGCCVAVQQARCILVASSAAHLRDAPATMVRTRNKHRCVLCYLWPAFYSHVCARALVHVV